jgi:hypothetical protein
VLASNMLMVQQALHAVNAVSDSCFCDRCVPLLLERQGAATVNTGGSNSSFTAICTHPFSQSLQHHPVCVYEGYDALLCDVILHTHAHAAMHRWGVGTSSVDVGSAWCSTAVQLLRWQTLMAYGHGGEVNCGAATHAGPL